MLRISTGVMVMSAANFEKAKIEQKSVDPITKTTLSRQERTSKI
jgi:hypothetical protein